MVRSLSPALLCWLMAFSTGLGADVQSSLKITARRDNDKVTLSTAKERTLIDVESPMGISGMTVERVGDRWPQPIVVRLRLSMLESLLIASGKTALHATVSSDASHKIREWRGDDESKPLDSKDADWIDIKIVEAKGKGDENSAPPLPRRIAYFELSLPRSLFADNPQSLKIDWIDAYR